MSRPLPIPKMSLVTGAANGLGLEISRQILKSGGRVVAIDRDHEQLLSLSSRFPELCMPITCDLAQTDEIDILIKKLAVLVKIHGPFNLTLFNAAISATGRFEMIPEEIHHKIFALNTLSPMVMTSRLMQNELMRKGSAMVFISSLSHQTGYPGAATYAASKDAIAVYAKSIRKAYARKKVHVMSVFPGPIRTQMAAQHAPKNAKPGNRMPPEKMALRILRAASQGQPVLFPDAISRLTAAISRVLPGTLTKLMRKIIFEKLDKETF